MSNTKIPVWLKRSQQKQDLRAKVRTEDAMDESQFGGTGGMENVEDSETKPVKVFVDVEGVQDNSGPEDEEYFRDFCTWFYDTFIATGIVPPKETVMDEMGRPFWSKGKFMVGPFAEGGGAQAPVQQTTTTPEQEEGGSGGVSITTTPKVGPQGPTGKTPTQGPVKKGPAGPSTPGKQKF